MSEENQTPFSGDEELRNWLSEYIKKYPHHTTAILSRSEFIGISRKALDAYLEETYFLPKERGGHGANPFFSTIEDAIRDYRARIEGTKRHPLAHTFKETQTYRQLRAACSIAINEM